MRHSLNNSTLAHNGKLMENDSNGRAQRVGFQKTGRNSGKLFSESRILSQYLE
jgi:hypothetical protein